MEYTGTKCEAVTEETKEDVVSAAEIVDSTAVVRDDKFIAGEVSASETVDDSVGKWEDPEIT